LALETLFAGREMDLAEMMFGLKKTAADLNLPMGERRKTYNSRLAQETGKWAEARGRGKAFHQAVFHAYFAEGRNIGRTANLIRLAVRAGLPEDEAREVLEGRTFREAVDEDWSRALRMGITAVPTFVMDHQRVVGAQPYEHLAAWMKAMHVEKC